MPVLQVSQLTPLIISYEGLSSSQWEASFLMHFSGIHQKSCVNTFEWKMSHLQVEHHGIQFYLLTLSLSFTLLCLSLHCRKYFVMHLLLSFQVASIDNCMWNEVVLFSVYNSKIIPEVSLPVRWNWEVLKADLLH